MEVMSYNVKVLKGGKVTIPIQIFSALNLKVGDLLDVKLDGNNIVFTPLKSHNSEKEQVQKFLEEIMILDDEKFNILQELRNIVFKNYKKTGERMMYGGIMFSLDDDFGGIFVRKNHVSFEFVNGFRMNDQKKLLEGTGKFRRHLKIKYLADIKNKDVDFFVKQAI